MAQRSKEPCKKEACDIQACLSKNNFLSQRANCAFDLVSRLDLHAIVNCCFIMCLKVIELLQSCCEKCNYNSTHCASVSGLLKQKPK
ncbi:cx9C motif-containing protein 4 [Quillaja saponaria]|uniref:Cx9C motif-containing protein 4 n=1 Tax=Quillaja saponaria TaxID=32244 RepID=A0AAD7M128_QUISA|nr:cx9C motif-containing protein 4 [Quillaja saponaria]